MPGIVSLLLLVAGAVFGAVGFTRGTRLRRILATPTTAIPELRPGFREVKGRAALAEGAEFLQSPMSGTACVYYEFLVEEHRQQGRDDHWHTVVRDRAHAPCVLQDGSAELRLALKDAELVLSPDNRARSGLFQDAPAGLEATLQERYGRSTQGLLFNKHMRFTETVVREGDPLYALGTVTGSRAEGLVMEKGQDLFIVSDLPEDQLVSRFRTQAVAFYVAAVVCALVAVIVPAAAHR